jgi:hypothetical protein
VNGARFRELLATIATAWIEGDTATALACFTDDARYTEPPDTQHYEGRAALFEFFGGDDPPPMQMAWHTVLFDEDEQMGAAEYTYTGRTRTMAWSSSGSATTGSRTGGSTNIGPISIGRRSRL